MATVWDTTLENQLVKNGYNPNNPITWAIGEAEFESVFTNYQPLEQLLKNLPAAQTSAQNNAGDAFQAMIMAKDGKSLDPSIAGPLSAALGSDPNLQTEIISLWNQHPDALTAIIPKVQANPQNTKALVEAAYADPAAAVAPLTGTASAPPPHKKSAAPKPGSPAPSAPSNTPAATTNVAASNPAAGTTPPNPPASTSGAPAAPSSQTDNSNNANNTPKSGAGLGGPAAGLAMMVGGGGIASLISMFLQMIEKLFASLGSLFPSLTSLFSGGLGGLLGGGSGASGGGILSGLLSTITGPLTGMLGPLGGIVAPLMGMLGLGGQNTNAPANTNTQTANANTAANPPMSAQTANNLYRTAALGFGINSEESKASQILTKDGKPAVTYTKGANGLDTVNMAMPDGSKEQWRQTDVMTNAATGAKFMAYERIKPDGSLFTVNGKPQVFIESVGSLNTQQDVAAFQKIVGGQDQPALFDQTSKFTQEWIQKAQQRYGANMPDITIGAHSMGAYTVSAITQTLNAAHLTPGQTIEVEPVGAGAGIRFLANGNTDAANKLAQNVYSFRDKDDPLFSMPGGQWQHANSMVGTAYQYANPTNATPGGFPGNIIANHSLTLPAAILNQEGVAGFTRTPSQDTPASQFVNDTALKPEQQDAANLGLVGYTAYVERAAGGNPPRTPDLDLSEQTPSNTASIENYHARPNIASLKLPANTNTETADAAPSESPQNQSNVPKGQPRHGNPANGHAPASQNAAATPSSPTPGAAAPKTTAKNTPPPPPGMPAPLPDFS